MLNQIFNPNNLVFRSISKAMDLLLLGMVWLVCSLPIVTLGAASTALYYSVVKCIRRGEDKPFGNFFRCFRENFKVSLPLSLLTVALWFLLILGNNVLVSMANAEGGSMTVLYIAYSVALLIPIGVLCYAFPVLSRFELGAKAVLASSFKLALRHLPSTVILVLMLLEAVKFCLTYWYVYFLPLFLCPGIVALLSSLFLERIFKPLTPQEGGSETGEDGGETDKPWYLK